MPAIGLIAASLVIKACAIWCRLQEKKEESEGTQFRPTKLKVNLNSISDGQSNVTIKSTPPKPINCEPIIFYFLLIHCFGVVLLNGPEFLLRLSSDSSYNAKLYIVYTLYALCGLMALMPLFVRFKKCERSVSTLNVFSLLELGTALVCISMNNFSLGLFCGVLCVPFALFINSTTCRLVNNNVKLVTELIN